MKKTALLAACAVASVLLAASAASAAPLGAIGNTAVPADSGLVQQVHAGNVHRACELGQGGWHYHSRYRGRIDCRPARPGIRYWIWRSEGGRSDWYHSRDRRWR